MFRGFPPEMPRFFRQLKKNNNREWFQANKATYEEKVKAPMAELVEDLNREFASMAPDFVTDPAKAIYRIYRDTRFSKDKTPYKDHIGALFIHRSLDKHTSAGFYVSASDDEVEVAGGVYMPGPGEILVLRNMFAERYEEFRALTENRPFRALAGELKGEELSRMPMGFPSDHPAGSLLRRKQWYFYVTLDGGLATSNRMLPEVRKRFAAMLPAVRMMNEPVLAGKRKEAARALF